MRKRELSVIENFGAQEHTYTGILITYVGILAVMVKKGAEDTFHFGNID